MNAFTTKDGATLMLAAPTIAIHQPLKIVVRKTLMGRFGLHTTVPTTFNSARICRGTWFGNIPVVGASEVEAGK